MVSPQKSQREGRALLVTAILLFVVIGYSIGRFLWISDSSAPSEAETEALDIRSLHFWKASEVKDRLAKGEKIVFLDLRNTSLYKSEHIVDAEWHTLDSLNEYTPQNGSVPVLVLNPSSETSDLQAINDIFTKKKIDYAILDGGLEAWREVGGAIISEGDPNSYLDQTKVTFVNPKELDGLRSTLPNLFLVDVQSAPDFGKSHIPGAHNFPLTTLEKRRGEIPTGKSLVVYGSDDLSSFQGGVRLFDLQYFGIRVLSGGLPAWKNAGLAVEP